MDMDTLFAMSVNIIVVMNFRLAMWLECVACGWLLLTAFFDGTYTDMSTGGEMSRIFR